MDKEAKQHWAFIKNLDTYVTHFDVMPWRLWLDIEKVSTTTITAFLKYLYGQLA